MALFFVGERRVRVVASRIQGITVEIGKRQILMRSDTKLESVRLCV